jgi:hypothetical protein
MMNGRCDKPDRKARTKYNRQAQPLVKTYKSHKEKQNTRYNAPQSAFGVLGHQVEIAGIIPVQPDEHDKAGQRHHGNQPGQRRQLAPYPRAETNNTHTNQQLDSKSHIDRPHLIASKALKVRHRRKAISYLALGFTQGSSLNEPDSQRIAIVMTIVGINRRNQHKDQVNYAYCNRYEYANADKRQRYPYNGRYKQIQ